MCSWRSSRVRTERPSEIHPIKPMREKVSRYLAVWSKSTAIEQHLSPADIAADGRLDSGWPIAHDVEIGPMPLRIPKPRAHHGPHRIERLIDAVAGLEDAPPNKEPPILFIGRIRRRREMRQRASLIPHQSAPVWSPHVHETPGLLAAPREPGQRAQPLAPPDQSLAIFQPPRSLGRALWLSAQIIGIGPYAHAQRA